MIKRGRGQIEMSYGMIFSIILIAVFVVVAIYVIIMLFSMQCSIKNGYFIKDFQKDVDKVWTADGTQNVPKTYFLCKDVKEVCLFNYDADQKGEYTREDELFREIHSPGDNICFYPSKDAPCQIVNHIDTNTLTKNPYCIKANEQGIVNFTLKKNPKEDLVRIV